MSNLSSRSALLAALFAAAQLAACGGSHEAAPAAAPVASPAPTPPAPPVTTVSPLKVLTYSVAGQADGSAAAEAGQISAPTTSGATLSLGAQSQIVLTVDGSNNGFVITTPDYLVVNRYAGSVLMLCDATTTPGTSVARYVAVAASVAEGGVAPAAVTSAEALAGLRFFKLSDCACQSANGSQGQNTAADAESLFLEFDGNGNASSNASAANYSAAQVSDMLSHGPNESGSQFAAWRFTIDGQPRTVIVERGRYDAADAASGFVRLWLPQ